MRTDINQPFIDNSVWLRQHTEIVMSTPRLKARGMSNAVRKIVSFRHAGKTPPRQPDYPDELSDEQLDAIRKLAECHDQEAYSPLHSPAW